MWAIRKHLESGQEQGRAAPTSQEGFCNCPGLPIQQTTPPRPQCRCEQVCCLLGWNSKPSLHMKNFEPERIQNNVFKVIWRQSHCESPSLKQESVGMVLQEAPCHPGPFDIGLCS